MAVRGRHRRHQPNRINRASLTVTAGGVGIAVPLIGTGTAHAADVDTWNKVAACESSNNWSINTGNGYYGGLQEDLTFWVTYGPHRFDENGNDLGLVAARPDLASRADQIAAAEAARATRGFRPWPTCARRLGWL